MSSEFTVIRLGRLSQHLLSSCQQGLWLQKTIVIRLPCRVNCIIIVTFRRFRRTRPYDRQTDEPRTTYAMQYAHAFHMRRAVEMKSIHER